MPKEKVEKAPKYMINDRRESRGNNFMDAHAIHPKYINEIKKKKNTISIS